MGNKLTVIIGDAPRISKLNFGLANMGKDVQFPVEFEHNGNEYMVIDCTESLNNETILSGLDCLQDHMENVELKDWTKRFSNGDYNIDYGIYYGQNIEILTYIIS